MIKKITENSAEAGQALETADGTEGPRSKVPSKAHRRSRTEHKSAQGMGSGEMCLTLSQCGDLRVMFQKKRN